MNIRNFVIIAHIDHGKSTLADRFLELTGTIDPRSMREQFLDLMDLERERGITIKMQPVRMIYRPPGASMNQPQSGFDENDQRFNKRSDSSSEAPPAERAGIHRLDRSYILNLIDTPGHVDFSYEVSRALAAVEGAILLVDASQGIQAQTVENLRLAQAAGLAIIPAINKIDLATADGASAAGELASLLGVVEDSVHRISGKVGTGVRELLVDVIRRVPGPKTSSQGGFRALVFDSRYDPYQGVVASVRVVEGTIKRGEKIRLVATKANAEANEVGIFTPQRQAADVLGPGEIGYIATGIKVPGEVRVGDTITKLEITVEPLAGYRQPTPVVFASVFPEHQDDYAMLGDSLAKLKLSDAAISYEPLGSPASLGRGFRVGFLGLLHREIVAERLRREYNLRLVFSNPSVAFRVRAGHGSEEIIHSAFEFDHGHDGASIEERWVDGEIITPPGYLGAITSLVSDRAGFIRDTTSLSGGRLLVRFEAPLRELIVDFFDVLKSVSQGFASVAYTLAGWKRADLVRLDILVAGQRVEAFSEIVPRARVARLARERVAKLQELLGRELFPVSLQAEAEGRIIARETIPALKKDVTGYLYGGDRTRKMKLWKKQQRGKKRLGKTGRVKIPAEVFLAMLKRESS